MIKKKSRCVKAWAAVASKITATNSVSFPSNGDYFVTAHAGKLPEFFINIIPAEKLADSVIEWIEHEGWQDMPFEELANTLKRELERFPKKTLDMISEMEITLVQSRLEGLEEIKRQKTAPLGNILKPVTA